MAIAMQVPGGAALFQRIFTRLGCHGRPPEFRVTFHPYASLSHTIRLRDEVAHVRLSDLLYGVRTEVLEAIAAILLGQLYRRTPPDAMVRMYREYSVAPKVRRRMHALRKKRIARAKLNPRGEHHDLAPIYEEINREYFRRDLKQPRLGWSSRAWRRQLGCYDAGLNHILINRRLDREEVPGFVIGYVMYHEMLHQKHPLKLSRAACRVESHSAEFRREEKRFRDYAAATRFLKRLR